MRVALVVITGFLALPLVATAASTSFAGGAPAVAATAGASDRLTLPAPKAGRA